MNLGTKTPEWQAPGFDTINLPANAASAINQTRKYTGTRQFKVILRGGVVDPRAENAGQP